MQIAPDDLKLPVRLRTESPMTDEEFMRFSGVNEPLRMEQESNGDILVMSPTGAEGGGSNADLMIDLGVWARQDGRGKVFDFNAGFRLQDGSVRAADAAWVIMAALERLNPRGTAPFLATLPGLRNRVTLP